MFEVLKLPIWDFYWTTRYTHYPASDLWVCMSVCIFGCPCSWDITDVTLVDDDSGSILADEANRAILDNMGNQAGPGGGWICHKCKWYHLVAKFSAKAGGATWWPNCHCKMQLPQSKYRILSLQSCSLWKLIWTGENWQWNSKTNCAWRKKNWDYKIVHFLGPVFFSSHYHSSSSSILLLSLTESIVIALACANILRSAPQYRMQIPNTKY